ncbi:MAG TPA: transglutaminase family protein [Terricaulis sp.]|nr:transglutaminase family protein [Terricaulis sp.]
MRLAVRHLTRYAYDPPAERAALRLRLYPPRFRSQAVEAWRVSVNGEEIAPMLTNGLGEGESIWTAHAPQGLIEIVAEGVVEAQEASGVVRGLADHTRAPMYLRGTPRTAADEAIVALAQGAREADPLATLHRLSNAVRDAVDYTPAATHHSTTAAEALAQGAGVCQDHAHIFIAAARVLAIPARYVAGYLAPNFEGAHETHAWAEAYVPDLGWVGFDPANRQCPTDAYIRLCAGFDAADAAPVRGAVSFGAGEALDVSVEVAQQ